MSFQPEIVKTTKKETQEISKCKFCAQEHSPAECRAFNAVKEKVSRNGIAEIGWEKGANELLNDLAYSDHKKFKELVGALASHYGMGEYVQEKDQRGKLVEKFAGEQVSLTLPGSKEEISIKINKEPIALECGQAVWRYNTVKENGEIDPRVKINSLDTLQKLRDLKEKRIEEGYKKAA